MLLFLVLSWSVEEKAFVLLGEPTEGSPQFCLPALMAAEWGCLCTWHCKGLKLVLGPAEEQDMCPFLMWAG